MEYLVYSNEQISKILSSLQYWLRGCEMELKSNIYGGSEYRIEMKLNWKFNLDEI